MNIYDIAIAPGAGRQIDVQADYIYFRTGSAGGGDTTIVFQPISGGEAVYLQPGQAYKMPAAMRGKTVSWIIRNLKGEGTIAGVILMGEGEFQDNRVSGSVEMIDGGKARTQANQAFMTNGMSPAVAANYSLVQLFNPLGSGKNAYVEQIICTTTGAGLNGLVARFNNAAISGMSQFGASKRAGGLNAALGVQIVQTNVIPGGQSFMILDKQQKTAKFTEPLMLPPGFGLLLFNLTPNEDISVTYEWFEETVG